MKSYKQIFLEMPIPIDMNEFPKTKKGDFKSKYAAKTIKDHLANSFQSLGKGSSRIGFDCPVPIELFHYDDKIKYDIGGSKVNTVIKLALNPKGIFQNTVEIELWMNLEDSIYSKFLCPIYDWSGNPKYKNDNQYVLDCGSFNVDINSDYNGAYWIQMAKCSPATKNKKIFSSLFKETFGDIKSFYPDSYQNELGILQEMVLNPMYFDTFLEGKDYDDYDNLIDFIDMCRQYDIGDIGQLANWGIYKGNPVLIDYGFDDRTQQIYWNKKNINFLVYINNSGEIKIRFQKLNRRY